MVRKRKAEQLFYEYFEEWIELYKVGAVRAVTLNKYNMSLQRVYELAPSLKIGELQGDKYWRPQKRKIRKQTISFIPYILLKQRTTV